MISQKKEGEVMICVRSGSERWIFRQNRESRKDKVTQSHTEATDTAKEKMITSRQQPDGMRSISDGK